MPSEACSDELWGQEPGLQTLSTTFTCHGSFKWLYAVGACSIPQDAEKVFLPRSKHADAQGKPEHQPHTIESEVKVRKLAPSMNAVLCQDSSELAAQDLKNP
jgi:hypothetical protein